MTKLKCSIIILLSLLTACGESQETIKPAVEDMTESVYASLTIEPEDMYDVYTTISGIIDSIAVSEGDTVHKGQLIALISSDISHLNTENAKLNLELAKKRYTGDANLLEKLEDQISANNDQLQLDSINYFRQKRLMEKNVGSKIELQTKKLKYDISKSNRDMLQKEYEQLQIQLKNQLKQSQNSLSLAKVSLDDYMIRADIDGSVYSIMKEKGEIISPQTPIAKIGRSNSFLIVMRIDEVDIARVALGQKIVVSLDAYKGQTFSGKVSKIYPLKDDRTQTFKVEAIFDIAPERLYAGLSGEANIIISKKKNVLTIPLEYLTDDQKVLTDTGRVAVELGVRNIDKVEIISGINKTTEIKKP
jgi:multidrug efflux pump subunit AcrA (membrane-fusion protein)